MRSFLESDLEEIIYTADREELDRRGLHIPANAKLLRQARIGNYGVADLISAGKAYTPIEKEPYLDISLFELKKDRVGISAFLQAVGYAKGIHSYLIDHRQFYNYKLNIILIGSNVDDNGSFCFLPDLIKGGDIFEPCTNGEIENLTFMTYSYGIDGIHFTCQDGYKLTNEGF